eukprot:CAMPEP_0185595752 /NCGR_PEP_ID=MMETSP0434-20130131/79394_1 /TAXON_ID=626734 ORGANISM="Favella taraikaensis, Strain Fe Narragansett Bay" /NCGR_SAMPLE_ID=MMETSP0434 /ASSEMBLY_ACC=CAM_ASM_000379 /LENGTH=102 /DNA_ID=CAMNT_0028223957 /DNA_START=238 /DNA_END=546 /DNA_ORIENTATION=-
MIKEYFYAEDPKKWEEFVEIDESEEKRLVHFTEKNLITQDSREEPDLKNISEGSLILAPNNSSLGSDDLENFEFENFLQLFEPKYEMISYKTQARDADLKYE